MKNLDSTPHNISQLAVSDSGLSSLGSSQQGQRSRSNSKLTPTSVKNSLSSGVSNISNFMGKIKNKLDPDEIDDDRYVRNTKFVNIITSRDQWTTDHRFSAYKIPTISL